MHDPEHNSSPPEALPSPCLLPFDVAALDEDGATILALTPLLRVSFVNRAWNTFATNNNASWREGEWGVGTAIMDAIPDPLKPFYSQLFTGVITRREVVEHDYECSTPTTFRRFRMRTLPIDSGDILVVHSLLDSSPHAPCELPPQSVVRVDDSSDLEQIYRDKSGIVVQCCHCRRVRRLSEATQWDWQPTYVKQQSAGSRISHGLCQVCLDYYYPSP